MFNSCCSETVNLPWLLISLVIQDLFYEAKGNAKTFLKAKAKHMENFKAKAAKLSQDQHRG